jgi:hypothetical protein
MLKRGEAANGAYKGEFRAMGFDAAARSLLNAAVMGCERYA